MKICRICLKIKDLQPLSTKINEFSITECLGEIYKYIFEEANFPEKVCESCLHFICVSIEEAHITLKKWLEHQIIEELPINDEENCEDIPQDNDAIKCEPVKLLDKDILLNTECDTQEKCDDNLQYDTLLFADRKNHEEISLTLPTDKYLPEENAQLTFEKTCKIKCVCGETFTRKKHLEKHILSHTYPVGCAICQNQKCENLELNSVKDLYSHLQQHDTRNDKKHVCETCGKGFKLHYSLVQHQFSHNTEKKFECDICFKKFVFRCTLSRHKLNIHSGTKRYKCNVCDKEYTGFSALKDHSYSHGDQQKPHSCTLCNKSYYSPTQLRNHMRRHTGERITCEECNSSFRSVCGYRTHKCLRKLKPFQCDKCNRAYSNESLYLKHNCTVEKKTTTKKKICDKCGKGFINNYLLKLHSRVHAVEEDKTWVECDICLKKLSSKSCLTKHRKIHTETPKHVCAVCSKAFRDSSTLKIHQRIHTGEKPYSCNFENCNKKFSDPSTLYTHKKVHEKIINKLV